VVAALGLHRTRHWLSRGFSRAVLGFGLIGCLAGLVPLASGQDNGTTVYLTVEQAPKTVFPEADRFERKDIPVTTELSRKLRQLAAPAKPTIWEPFYMTFIARKGDEIIGYAVICEEIGKHRPITFIVAVTPDGRVKDTALMMYREPQGYEVRSRGFLAQFAGKTLDNPIMQHQDIRNVSGATLSVRAMTRGVRKALAVILAVYLEKSSG
jgi:H+/Na+-translocating ferredoxin:NAD+ oxidoreductase subunit G